MTDVSLERHKEDWERLAEVDPMWAVLTAPDQRGGGWDADAFFATGAAEIEQVFAGVNGPDRPLGHGRALDFGCGVGRLTRALAGRFDTAVGVDISEAMVETARELNADVAGCEFRVNASADLRQFGDGEFDFVYSSLVLQHLPDRELVEGYVAEFLRVVAPEGLVVFGLPARIGWPYRLGLSRRLYAALRRLGVGEETILRRTRLTPMRMTAVPEPEMRRFLEAHGASLVGAEARGAGAVHTVRYTVAPRHG